MSRTAMFLLASFALAFSAVAIPQAEAASIGAAFSPRAQPYSAVQEAACRGWGRWCPPGFIRRCGPYRCRCVPC